VRIVLITADNLEHMYVANELAAAVPLDGIVVDHGRPISFLANIRRLWRKYTISQLASRAYMALMTRLWNDESAGRHSMLKVYGTENRQQFSRPDLLHHICGINTSEGLQTVSALQPDVLLIYGTVLVGSRILSLARIIALNMHTGISPFYRGADCAFWPIYNQELNMVGATVHECTKNVDGGRIFATARAHLLPDDDVFSVFARSVVAGTKLYVDVVQELIDGRLEGIEQDLSLGTEYKARMRDVRAERRVRKLIKEGIVRRYVESSQNEK
jgi:methionyl-tRNA formyltransferase